VYCSEVNEKLGIGISNKGREREAVGEEEAKQIISSID